MKLIIGLGNPEEKYGGTRHNLGFDVADDFRRKLNLGEWGMDKSFSSEIVKGSHQIILARPQTYMNHSGIAVAKIAAFYKIQPGDICIIHDELDLPLGHIKIRKGGGAGGHHGVESIIEQLGSDEFVRIRMGIGNQKTVSSEHGGQHLSAESFVLSHFLAQEKSQVRSMIKKALKALDILLTDGLEKAQNQFN